MPKKPPKLKFEEVFSGRIDYSAAADQPELVEAIIATLPNTQGTPEQKHDFACEIVSELPYVIAHAENKHHFPILRDKLLAISGKTKNSVLKFRQLLVESRARMGMNLNAADAMNPFAIQGVTGKEALAPAKAALSSVKSRERKQRQCEQSIVGEAVAEYLQIQSKFYFGKKFKSGKSRRTYEKVAIRDYDRLCDLLNEHYGIKISRSTKMDL